MVMTDHHITPQINDFPLCMHGINVRPSSRFISLLNNPEVSLIASLQQSQLNLQIQDLVSGNSTTR